MDFGLCFTCLKKDHSIAIIDFISGVYLKHSYELGYSCLLVEQNFSCGWSISICYIAQYKAKLNGNSCRPDSVGSLFLAYSFLLSNTALNIYIIYKNIYLKYIYI